MTRARPEVLAPAGDRAALEAAVSAGADAVYFGLPSFSARARATNVAEGELAAAMAHLRRHGVKGYVALNTLLFDSELEAGERAIRACAEAGVDALIVQDLGVAQLARAVAPQVALHASTQMTCTDAGAVELARSLGASRVILARELSLDEIAAITRATTVELEVFVHGALCIAYSGQCLTSEAIGGRSANRGACAQACRLPYELVVDGVVRELGDRAYLLSPEDLEAATLVPRLIDLGVRSLKIEGRLKSPEYVAATTRLYRAAVDAAAGGRAVAPRLRQQALQTYSRGSGPGFFAGIDHQRLVDGTTCEHRGLRVGTCAGVRRWRGEPQIVVHLSEAIARGDGLVVAGGREGAGEVGGRVWRIVARGREVERAAAGAEVGLWLGPSVALADAGAGRAVFRTSDPAAERAVRAAPPATVALDLRLSGEAGGPLTLKARSARGQQAEVAGDVTSGRSAGAPSTPSWPGPSSAAWATRRSSCAICRSRCPPGWGYPPRR